MLIISTVSVPIFANIQIQVDSVNVTDVYYVMGEDATTGERVISPTMTVTWNNPDHWASAEDIADIHEPDFYKILAENKTTGSEFTFDLQKGSDEVTKREFDLQDYMGLETGSLYEVTVTPYHYHDTEDGGKELATESGIAKSAFAVTDLNVEFESNDDSITVIWDNIGVTDFEYRIVYALGDYSGESKQALIDNEEGEITGLTIDSEDITGYYDSATKRNKLSYTITENIYPGQVYSVMVEPMVGYYEGYSVTRNRNYPVIHSVSTSIALTYEEVGENLKLMWEIPSSFKVGSDNDNYELVETRLKRYVDGQSSNIVIFDGDAGAIGYYSITKPIVETEFQLELTYKAVDDESKAAIEPVSNMLTYSPTAVLVVPTQPAVPELLSEDLLAQLRETHTTEEVRDILADEYLVPGSTYTGNLDDLLEQNITYSLDTESNQVNFTWGAFRRIDIDQTSDTYNETITDLNVYYDIWVTNSYDSLSYASVLASDQRYSSTDTNSLILSEAEDIVGFHRRLSAYYNDETGQIETIVPNQVYYIKIIAKKKIGNDELKSVPAIVTFYYTDDGSVYVPPLVAKPPLHVKEEDTTITSVTIGWKENWFELIDLNAEEGDPLDGWTTEAWIDTNGDISDTELDGAVLYSDYKQSEDGDVPLYYPIYLSQDIVEDFINAVSSSDMLLIDREIDLGNFNASSINYKFFKIPYAEVLAAIKEGQKTNPEYSFAEYYDKLVTEDKDGTTPLNWLDISPIKDPADLDGLIYTQDGLLPNTSYLFLLYPYRQLTGNEELLAHYPTPIIVATEPDVDDPNPNPTVPRMYVTDTTDREISLAWQYNTDFTYEIVYNTDDTMDGALEFEIELPATTDSDYPVNGAYYEVTVPNLFPDTGYYFYIRATEPNLGTISSWSNPVYGSTDDIDYPDPPKGIGIPPDQLMEKYGYKTGVTDTSIAITWTKNKNDTDSLNDDSNTAVYYTYILEAANNKLFIDPQYIESAADDSNSVIPDNAEILQKNLVNLTNLVSNRYYYFRMKTRVTVVSEDSSRVIVKESKNYSSILRIITDASDNEYDSDRDPALEILPSENYELIYDEDAQSLTYRFRDSSTDESGAADNNVDQRLISELIKRNRYEYKIDISKYKNNPITSRKVIIPYSILEAFDSYDIELQIDAGNLLVNIPGGALTGEVKRQRDQYGVAPTLTMTIKDINGYYDSSQMPKNALTAVSVPQEMKVRVRSNLVNKALSYSDKPLEIGLSTNNRYSVYGKNPLAYGMDVSKNWSELVGSYSQNKGALFVKTSNIGSYGAYIKENSSEIQSSKPSHWSESARASIDAKYTVIGLNAFDPNDRVSENEMINIVYSMVKEEDTIDVERYISKEQLNALYYSGIKVDTSKDGSSINREEAINMMIRAAEIRGNYQLDTDEKVLSFVNSNSSIDDAYKEALAKAVTSGMISDMNQIRAKDPLTYGELFTLWSKAEEL